MSFYLSYSIDILPIKNNNYIQTQKNYYNKQSDSFDEEEISEIEQEELDEKDSEERCHQRQRSMLNKVTFFQKFC